MKNAIIIGLLLLTSTAFMGLIVDESVTDINLTIRGDTHAQIMWGVIDCLLVVFCFFYGRQFLRVASRQPLIVAFVAWSTLSLAWSDDPQLSARRLLGLICTTAMGFVLGMKLEMKALLRLLVQAMAIAMVASIFAAILFPSFGVMANLDSGAWRGVFTHKNELGHSIGFALIAVICLLWDSRRHRIVHLSLLGLGVALLILSRSMTSTIVVALTLFLGGYWRLRLRPAQRFAVLAMATLLAVAGTAVVATHVDSVLHLVGRDSTLTGRVPMWRLAVASVGDRPLLGAGWDAFWPGPEGDRIRSLVHWDVPHAHNGFLEMSLNIGLIGLALYVAGFYDCLRRAARYRDDFSNPVRLWPLLYYVYTLFFFFTEAPAVDRHTLSFILYCAISVSMTEGARIQATESELEEEYAASEIPSDSRVVQEFQ